MDDMNLSTVRARQVRRRVYGRDFKLQVVRRLAQGLLPTQAVHEFGVSPVMLSRWMREWQKDPTHAFRGYGQRKPVADQIERLRRKVKRLQVERDLLKKASARFALSRNMRSNSLQSIEHSGL